MLKCINVQNYITVISIFVEFVVLLTKKLKFRLKILIVNVTAKRWREGCVAPGSCPGSRKGGGAEM